MAEITVRIGQGPNLLFSQGQEVLGSGSIVLFVGETLSFTIKEGLYSFRLDIALLDVGGQPFSQSSNQIAFNHAQITLINWNKYEGMSTTGRIPVATFGIKQTYITYAVHGIGTARVFHYTIYRDA